MKKKLIVLTGAGISAESGIATFRDADGLWEGHDIMEVASPQGFKTNPALVLDFYNKRRAQLAEVEPNRAHQILAELEDHYDITIITQNVDDLHERGGSSNIIHLHGELKKAKSSVVDSHVQECTGPIQIGDLAADGSQLRPNIVWFGEAVPLIEQAHELVTQADILLIIGTSMVVYPAAGLIHAAKPGIPIYVIDPGNPELVTDRVQFIQKTATEGLAELVPVLTVNLPT